MFINMDILDMEILFMYIYRIFLFRGNSFKNLYKGVY
jgi:hypothetical protein